MRVGLVVRGDGANAAARVRMLNVVPALEAQGCTVRVLPWQARNRADVGRLGAQTLRLARWADAVVVQRPRQPVALLRAVRRLTGSLVIDFDDALWVAADGSDAGERRRRLVRSLELATAVTVGSQVLADWSTAHAGGVPVHVVRSPVDLGSMTVSAHDPDRVPVVVWIGSPGNFRDFEPAVNEALTDLVAEGRIALRIVSSAPFAAVPSELVRWSVSTEAAALASADIGVMPLEDTERSRGRCGFKAIQYLAAGLPVVASPVGVAPELVVPGLTGALASSSATWRAAIDDLAASPTSRRELGRAGRSWVEQHATIEVSADTLLRALRAGR